MRICCAALCGAILLLMMISPPEICAFEYTPSKIRVKGLYSLKKKEFLYLLGIKAGEEINDEILRVGIKRAFLKGIFEDIQVRVSDEEPGLLKILVTEREFITDITVRGNREFSDRHIKKHLMVNEGDHLRYDRLAIAKEQLEDYLMDKGYPEAVVGFRVRPTGNPYRVELVVNIDEGTPLIVEYIDICGSEKMRVPVRRMIRMYSGAVYDQIELREQTSEVRKYLVSQGYIEPMVGPYTYDNGVLTLCVIAGPRVNVEIKGNSYISTGDLKDVLPFQELEDVSEDLVLDSAERMYKMYQEKGFNKAQIAPFFKESRDEKEVSFFIFEGPRDIVGSISIKGSHYPESRLIALMLLREGRQYDPGMLESDKKRIRDYYVALGYRDVKVEIAQIEKKEIKGWEKEDNPIYEDFNQKVDVRISIDEGQQVVISSVTVLGNEQIPTDRLLKAANLEKGDPYNEVDIQDAWRRVQNTCRSFGYAHCSVDVKREVSEEGIHVVFLLNEGRKIYFGKTIVKGNRDTRIDVIMRELQYGEGDSFDQHRLEETRRNLYKLRLFSRVNTEILDWDGQRADILLEVQEAEPGTVEFGIGYGEYEEYRGSFGVSYRNLFGMNREVSLMTEFSSLESRYILNYREPWLFEYPVTSRTFLLHESRKAKNVDTGEILYRIRRYTASTGLEKQFTEMVRGDIYYEYTIADTYDLKPDVILSREDTGTIAISSLGPGLVYDSRDDPFDPKDGEFAGLKMKYASHLLASETDFLKTTLHLSTYVSLSSRMVAALSGRSGAAKGFRDTEELPLVERFFLGGRSTVRGYDQDTLGPKGDRGTPVGGNYYLLGNIELRYRVAGNWRVVVFLDGGNVWILEEDVTFKDLKYTAGMGLQYNTPVGPFRGDCGYKLNREEGESISRCHISLGHAF